MKISDFKNRFRTILDKKNISQSELSRITAISQSTISDWYRGSSEPKQDKLDLIAKALNINPVWLLGYDVEMEIDDKNNDFNSPQLKILARNFEKLDDKNKNTILKMIEVMINEEDDNPYSE